MIVKFKRKTYSDQQNEDEKKKSSLGLGTLIHGAIGRPCTEGKIFSDSEDHTKRNLALIGTTGAVGTGGAMLINNRLSKNKLGKSIKNFEKAEAARKSGVNEVLSQNAEKERQRLNELYKKGKVASQADLHYELDKFKKKAGETASSASKERIATGTKRLESAMKSKRNAINKKIGMAGLGITAAAGLAYGGRKLYKKYKNGKESNGQINPSQTNSQGA